MYLKVKKIKSRKVKNPRFKKIKFLASFFRRFLLYKKVKFHKIMFWDKSRSEWN